MAEIKDFSRLCKAHKDCISESVICPLYNEDINCRSVLVDSPEKADRIITEWCKEHPQKTYVQDFFEKFPDAPVNGDGVPKICPYMVYKTAEKCRETILSIRRGECRDCWNEVMPECK